jgi:DNA replication and repair protein RecF
MDRLWIEGAEGRRRFLDRMTLSFAPEHGQLSLDYEKSMRERNRLLKEQVRDPHWYLALEAQMAKAGVAIDANRRAALNAIAAAQAGAQTAFPAADLALTHPDAPLPENEDDLRMALSDNRPRDMAAGRTLIGPHRADLEGIYATKAVPARDCSTGEQKALLVSLILANARALPQAPLLLLDEVSAHLDAGRRAALYDEICALGAQAWMTGTGPELFDDLGDRAQRFEIRESGGISEVHHD